MNQPVTNGSRIPREPSSSSGPAGRDSVSREPSSSSDINPAGRNSVSREPSSSSGINPAGRDCVSRPACARCGRPLVPDEIALTRKLINRGTRTFFCLSCLSAHFQVSESILQDKILQFKEMGCTLFG